VRDLVSLGDVVEEMGLGPNGCAFMAARGARRVACGAVLKSSGCCLLLFCKFGAFSLSGPHFRRPSFLQVRKSNQTQQPQPNTTNQQTQSTNKSKPNTTKRSALLAAMEYLEDHLADWLGEELAGYGDEDYLVLDCPGACGRVCVFDACDVADAVPCRLRCWKCPKQTNTSQPTTKSKTTPTKTTKTKQPKTNKSKQPQARSSCTTTCRASAPWSTI
jgi:hypothetical protein